MKKALSFFLITSLLVACASSSEKIEEVPIATPVEVDVEEPNFEVLEEEEESLSAYQLAAKTHPEKERLPYHVFLKPNKELYNVEGIVFHKIINAYKNYFLTAYKSYATEVENDYYITFDYKGNQLDAALVNTIAIDLDGEIVFNTDTTFQVNSIKKEIEWDEADAIEVGEPKRDTTYYTLTNKGKINEVES